LRFLWRFFTAPPCIKIFDGAARCTHVMAARKSIDRVADARASL